jgi:hypothetical protein
MHKRTASTTRSSPVGGWPRDAVSRLIWMMIASTGMPAPCMTSTMAHTASLRAGRCSATAGLLCARRMTSRRRSNWAVWATAVLGEWCAANVIRCNRYRQSLWDLPRRSPITRWWGRTTRRAVGDAGCGIYRASASPTSRRSTAGRRLRRGECRAGESGPLALLFPTGCLAPGFAHCPRHRLTGFARMR